MARGLKTSFSHFARWGLLIGALSFFGASLSLFSGTRCDAASCVTGNGPLGSCFIAIGSYPGEFPFAITSIDAEQRVIVADLFSGVFYRFDQDALATGLESAVAAPGPGGLATTTGLAFNSDDGFLYWILDNGSGQQLVRTNTSGGASLVIGALASPLGGLIGDMTYQPATGSFWAVDLENDICFEFDDTANLVVDINNDPVFFTSPGLAPGGIGGQAFGGGITAVPDPLFTFFDIPNGFPVDGRSSRVSRVEVDGTPFGYNYKLNADNNVTGFAGGIAYSADGFPGTSLNVAVEYIVDATAGRILLVPAVAPNFRGITGVAASADADSNVELTWTNGILYSQLVIRRNGVIVTTLTNSTAGPNSFTDLALDAGTYTYTLTPSTPAATLPAQEISVVVGPGRLLNHAAHNGDNALGITVVESTARVYVADLNSGTTHRYNKALDFIDTIPSPFGVATTTGLAWRATSDTLFWINADTNQLQETDLDGVAIGTPVTVNSPAGGIIGDMGWDPISDTFFAVDVTQRVYFNFDAQGTSAGVAFSSPTIVGGTAAFGNGVTVVPGAIAFLDIVAGPAAAGRVNQVARLTSDGTFADLSFSTAPSTYSGFVNSLAFTPSGSEGVSSEFLIGNDTNTLYEVSLDVVLSNPFRRGDANGSGGANLEDALFILNFLFVEGPTPTCLDAADTNDIAGVELTDATYLLNFLFGSGPAIPAPGANACGLDGTDDDNVTCDEYLGC